MTWFSIAAWGIMAVFTICVLSLPFRDFLCWLGLHRCHECKPNRICEKAVKKCKHCMATYCKVEGRWMPCKYKKNECEWTFNCGFE